MKLDLKGIHEYQQNRDPYLMIDYANKVIPGKSAEGYKQLKKDEWFFRVHWPGDPNMPGMLQTEALIQMSALIVQTMPGNKGKTLYLVDANNLKFIKKILPGDKLKIFSKLTSWKRGLIKFDAEGFVENKKTCRASFTLIIPGSINVNVRTV
jgi:3-hydroxyacyl-[acyl-carrier-protein] dehydratase|tara:strand:- start:2395 stop:2850 length:456 start_codon:yes stop_codon:yes gene_type:complete